MSIVVSDESSYSCIRIYILNMYTYIGMGIHVSQMRTSTCLSIETCAFRLTRCMPV